MRHRFVFKPKAAMLVLLSVGCFAIFGCFALAQESRFEVDTTDSYRTFDGVDYLIYEGRFITTVSGNVFSAPFEIVAPADPQQGNGRLVVELIHPAAGPDSNQIAERFPNASQGISVRDRFLGRSFLFAQGFSHVGICWRKDGVICSTFEGHADSRSAFLAALAQALKAGQAAEMVGDVEYLYGIGHSAAAVPLYRLLLDPLGQNLFDLSMIMNTGWPLPSSVVFSTPPENPEPHVLPATAGRVMVFLTEGDVVLWGALLRDDLTQPNYRSYEVAGGAHIPAARANQRTGITGVDWKPVLRALFLAGDRWVSEGIEPPASTFLDEAVAGEIDPVVGRVTGIARDANLNATGGITLPDVALGRGQFLALGGPVFTELGVDGTFVDLACEPLPDGSVRFADHDTYVSQFRQVAEQLVEDGFLLPDAADGMIEWATESNVGRPGACP